MPAAKASLRILLALAWVVLSVAYILRSAFVAVYSDHDLALAERLWPDHPSVLASRAMMDVAGAAAQGRGLDTNGRTVVNELANAEPLAFEPFLIAGAEAQRNSDTANAERLLLEARQRNPRAPAPRFLLAEEYISQGRIREGLPEAAVLGRLVPGSLEPLSRAFANYIQTAGVPAGAWETLRSNPDLSDRILNQLAADPANADLLVKLAELGPRTAGPAPGWQSRLINGIVEAGDYGRARQIWAKLADRDVDAAETIHDPHFRGSSAPAPFNWAFATQSGVIESQNGSLHILYFGRDDVTLASQLLVLRPGRYRLRMSVSGQFADPQSLRWKVGCLPDKIVLLDRSIGPGSFNLEFEVSSSGCGAQWLQLDAQAGDSSRSSDFLISNLSLAAEGRR